MSCFHRIIKSYYLELGVMLALTFDLAGFDFEIDTATGIKICCVLASGQAQ